MANKPSQAEMDEWFKAFDTDGSGKIEANELRAVVKGYYSDCAKCPADDAKIDADVAAIMKEVDTSGDGKIDKNEFFKFFQG